jgi:hypothetical protein
MLLDLSGLWVMGYSEMHLFCPPVDSRLPTLPNSPRRTGALRGKAQNQD